MMTLLIGLAGLALDGSQNRASGEVMQATADATSTSAATLWASDNPSAPPPNGASDVGTQAATIAGVNGLPVAALNMCTGGASAYNVVYYDVAESGGPCGGPPAGWKSRLEVRIPPSPVPAPCIGAPVMCVQVIATRQVRNPLMAWVGQPTTTITMQSTAIGTSPMAAGSDPLGIAALGTTEFHTIYAAGTGKFVVNGDVFDNNAGSTILAYCFTAAGGLDAPASPLGVCPVNETLYNFSDQIDARNSSSIVVSGKLTTVSGYPFDTLAGEPLSRMPLVPNNVGPGYPYGAALPQYVDTFCCGAGASFIAYGSKTELNPMAQFGLPGGTSGQMATNPAVAALGSTPDKNASICGGPAPRWNTQATTPIPYPPGVYTFPLDVTGSAGAGPLAPTFGTCARGQPGIFIFEQGLYIHPASGANVYGSNALFVTQKPVPALVLANNVGITGVGNGGPIGEVDFGGNAGTGMNLSAAFGGTGTIDLAAPSSGPYKGILMWQAQTSDSGAAARGNYGFNTAASDNATVTVQGIIVNTTMGEAPNAPNVTDRFYTWPGPLTTVPFSLGGMFISGVPVLLGGTDPVGPQGSDIITGSVIVDTFLTQGNAATVINGVPSALSTIVVPSTPRLVN